jgi:vancomycin resistance protein YoaR
VATAEAEAAKEEVERLLSRPRVVRFRGVSATLWPKRLGELVRTEPVDGSLAVTLDARGLEAALRARLGRFERAPRDAGFVPAGERVRITPSRPGRALDGKAIGASLLRNARAQAHLARFRVSQPALTTERARTLGIEQKISEFTTYHSCCAPRVNNIHRGADIIDGTVVLPGKSFDLNQVMGQRTEARGFLAAPQIFNGRLEDAVGGGVSQIATTMYNAAFFGGMQIVAHQPHEFYISRYPMGREATVSWGGPELIWRNDWPAAVLVNMTYTDTSVTVRLYSSKLGRKVTSVTGTPCCYEAPRTITVSNSSLPAGTTSTVQSAGPSGFTISYTRKVFRNGKLKRNERYTWRYKPENAIVEVGPPAPPKPTPKPKPTPEPAPDGEQASAQTASTSP